VSELLAAGKNEEPKAQQPSEADESLILVWFALF